MKLRRLTKYQTSVSKAVTKLNLVELDDYGFKEQDGRFITEMRLDYNNNMT